MHAAAREVAATTPPRAAYGRPDWSVDGRDWPNREFSRFVRAGAIRWHVQIAGSGPVLLLLHGTGAATHSWRDMLPELAKHFTVIAPDFPGHGFTEQPAIAGMSLTGMAQGVDELLQVMHVKPEIAAGHSAGAAVLAQMCITGAMAPHALISLNGALLPLAMHGARIPFMAPLAKLFASNALVPAIFAWQAADGKVIQRLLAGTGSAVDAEGAKFYGRLARRSGHAGAALKMMAHWKLADLALSKLQTPLLQIIGMNDRSIPPDDARAVQRLIADAPIIPMPGLGHLAHEEQPLQTAALITEFARKHGVLA